MWDSRGRATVEAEVVEGKGRGDEVRWIVAAEGGAEAKRGVGRQGIGADAAEKRPALGGDEGVELGEGSLSGHGPVRGDWLNRTTPVVRR